MISLATLKRSSLIVYYLITVLSLIGEDTYNHLRARFLCIYLAFNVVNNTFIVELYHV